MAGIETRTLRNGLVVVVERIEGVRSASVSWLTPGGAAFDPSGRLGRCAMWSELLLRGAGGLDSRAQADAADRAGMSRNVSATTRHMHLTATTLGERLDEALPLLADMVRRPHFDKKAVEPTRELCLMSLESLKDDPQERAVLAAKHRHHAPPLNRSTFGTAEGLVALTRDELASGWIETARPAGSILAVAGAVEPEGVFEAAERISAGWEGEPPALASGPPPERGYAHETDDSNQVQIVVMYDAPRESEVEASLERAAIGVLSGGMSGRLFTEVREKRGLCYAVSAGYATDRDFGRVMAYVGTTPERAQESLDVLMAELRRIRTSGGAVTEAELARAKIGQKSRLVFSGESTSARANALSADVFRLGRGRSLEEMAREVEGVTLDALNGYLAGRDMGRVTIQTLGPTALKPPI